MLASVVEHNERREGSGCRIVEWMDGWMDGLTDRWLVGWLVCLLNGSFGGLEEGGNREYMTEVYRYCECDCDCDCDCEKM